MTVKEYANKMGLTVQELCEVTGLSRQGLNNIIAKQYVVAESPKRNTAIRNLAKHISKEYTIKQNAVEKEEKERLEMLEMFYQK